MHNPPRRITVATAKTKTTTPAQQDKIDPPRNDIDAQAQAAAVDPSTVAAPEHVEPVGYEPPPVAGQKADEEPDFAEVARAAVNNVLQTNTRKALNDNNTAIRMAIAGNMGWENDGVHRVAVRVPASDDGKLVVEVRKDYDEWQSVPLDQ